MSDGNIAASGGSPHDATGGSYDASAGSTDAGGASPTMEDAKHEAAELTDTATGAAKDVAGTAKDEAASVARETKAQAKDLFEQGRQEFSDQASKQQQRLAAGLDSLGSELSTMARSSDGSGIASDLVQKASDRIAGAASWLGSREPSGVLQDVKAFARRRPGAFIGAALLAGIAAGRLTRALAANAKESSGSSGSTPALTSGASSQGASAPVGGAVPVSTVTPPPPAPYETPVFTESASRLGSPGQGVADERPDTL